jgi:hypothetical protein
MLDNSGYTHSQYVIIISIPLLQWLHEHAWMLSCTYIICLCTANENVSQCRKTEGLFWIWVKAYFKTRHWQPYSVAYRGGGGSTPPPPKFRSFDKAEPNSQFRGIYIHNNVIRIRISFICKSSETHDKGATAPRSPFSLPSVLNWICWPPPPSEKIPGYATDLTKRHAPFDIIHAAALWVKSADVDQQDTSWR